MYTCTRHDGIKKNFVKYTGELSFGTLLGVKKPPLGKFRQSSARKFHLELSPGTTQVKLELSPGQVGTFPGTTQVQYKFSPSCCDDQFLIFTFIGGVDPHATATSVSPSSSSSSPSSYAVSDWQWGLLRGGTQDTCLAKYFPKTMSILDALELPVK